VNAVDWISAVLVVAGGALAAVGGIGLVRLPDVFGRMHAATKPPTLGLTVVVAGAMLQAQDLADVGLLLLVLLVQFLTAPVGAHLIGRASYDAGGLLDDGTVVDELAEHQRRRPDER
jgi:multicomponent Na+:H+ antiporter subunit G